MGKKIKSGNKDVHPDIIEIESYLNQFGTMIRLGVPSAGPEMEIQSSTPAPNGEDEFHADTLPSKFEIGKGDQGLSVSDVVSRKRSKTITG